MGLNRSPPPPATATKIAAWNEIGRELAARFLRVATAA
jgi:hypothetical protein